MKKIAIAMLATAAMIGAPAFAASHNNQQPSQGTQMQQPQNNDQAQQSKQNQRNQQTAQNNQPMQPGSLSRGEIRQVQQALDKDGFRAGTPDGRWGPHTQDAVKQFQQSKQIQANGQLTEQTVADLGLDTSKFQQQQQK